MNEILQRKITRIHDNRELTPEGVELLQGIPHIPPYNRKDQWYVSFTNDGPVVLQDYTKTYTVTGDQARPQRRKR